MNTNYKLWWTGEDSNLRSSKERQVYSLLPLTARPPVRVKATLPNLMRAHQSETRIVGKPQSYKESGLPRKWGLPGFLC